MNHPVRLPDITLYTLSSDRRKKLIVSVRPPLGLEGENMFESEQPVSKSNLATLAAVVIIVLTVLLAATWFFTRA